MSNIKATLQHYISGLNVYIDKLLTVVTLSSDSEKIVSIPIYRGDYLELKSYCFFDGEKISQ